MIEDELKGLSLATEATTSRDCVLAAAGAASRQQRVTRWIHGIAFASMALMLLTFVFATKAEIRRATVADPDLRPRIPQYRQP